MEKNNEKGQDMFCSDEYKDCQMNLENTYSHKVSWDYKPPSAQNHSVGWKCLKCGAVWSPNFNGPCWCAW